jgi:polyadenylate-binding protein
VDQVLTAASLAALDEQTQKQVLGERLYPLVAAVESTLAGKITGMLLQMEVGEVVHLLDSRDALQDSIREALDVLQTAGFAADSQAPSA